MPIDERDYMRRRPDDIRRWGPSLVRETQPAGRLDLGHFRPRNRSSRLRRMIRMFVSSTWTVILMVFMAGALMFGLMAWTEIAAQFGEWYRQLSLFYTSSAWWIRYGVLLLIPLLVRGFYSLLPLTFSLMRRKRLLITSFGAIVLTAVSFAGAYMSENNGQIPTSPEAISQAPAIMRNAVAGEVPESWTNNVTTFRDDAYQSTRNATAWTWDALRMENLSVLCTGSMEPTLSCGDSVNVVRSPSQSEVQKGDIVVYYVPSDCVGTYLDEYIVESYSNPKGLMVIHRVVEVREDNDARAYVMRGDANALNDPCVIPHENVYGVVVE